MLLEGGRPVRLGSRAFDILLALIEQAGRTVSKRELIARVWPGSLIGESNLRVHVAALRKALRDGRGGARYILNDSGRGYRFVAAVTRAAAVSVPASADAPAASNLPAPSGGIVGREEVIDAIAAQLHQRAFISIVGPGGIGKTTVGIAVARQFLDSDPQPVAFVDLAAIDEAALAPTALATALGISAVTDDPIGSLIAFLADAHMLLLLDNCEHLIGHVAALAERIVKAAPGVRVLTTSREPLFAEREWVYRLPALAVPSDNAPLTVAAAGNCAAVQLFVERAASSGASFDLTEQNVETVARICRSLDGVPLALELVVAQMHVLGLEGVAARLNDQLLLLARGRRPARPRQQSIRETLSWSYGLLPPEEQQLLRALAVFRGAFPAESAAAVARGEEVVGAEFLDSLLSLADKSLVITDVTGHAVLYRLLHVTRAYATEQLVATGELSICMRRHACRCCSVLETAQADWERVTREEWLARYRFMMDDVRAALEWAFSAEGDLEVAVALTVAALPFGYQLCQIGEFQRRAELALERLARASPPQLLAELRLHLALGALYKNTQDSEERFLAAYSRAAELAERLGIAKYRVETLHARTVSELENGNTPAAVAAAEELGRVAAETPDPIAGLMADRAAAQAYHFAGQHSRAQEFAARVLAYPARSIPLSYSQGSVDRRVWMRIVQSRTLWLEGCADQARRIARESLDFAAGDGPFAKAHALALAAVLIAFWCGDLAEARRLSAALVEHCRRYTLSRWLKLGQCYQVAASGPAPESAVGPHPRVAEIFAWPANPLHHDLLATVSEDWLDDETIHRSEQGLSGWCAPEVLRVAAERTLRGGDADAWTRAESYLERSLAIAREQRALAWELRSTTSLAELWLRKGRIAQARTALAEVAARFREGHDTADLTRARQLLATMSA